MKTRELRSINQLYFGYEDIARALKIGPASARVSASRYVRIGLLMRLKRNIYVPKERWQTASREERFALANLGQTPSYISLMTALDYHEITTQVQRGFIESVAVKRTKEISHNRKVYHDSPLHPSHWLRVFEAVPARAQEGCARPASEVTG